MANAAQDNVESSNAAVGEMLPVDPFRSLYVHFGMLLGVEDFRSLDAYHRGKQWFHNAWLHREGSLWGLGVELDTERGEIRVAPGAAIDALGRELYLRQAACLNLAAWYDKHQDDPALAEAVVKDETSGALQFDAHITIQFKACLERQVPALSEPCDSSQGSTAYSRVAESVELLLQPGLADLQRQAGSLAFHRVRLLFALEDALEENAAVIAEDQAVLDARNEVLALPAAEQAAGWLKWLRHFAALDQVAMQPATAAIGEGYSLFPATSPRPLPLANIPALSLQPSDTGLRVNSGAVDNTVRPVHIPTATLQELVCGPMANRLPTDTPNSETSSSETDSRETDDTEKAANTGDAGGPRIDPNSLQLEGEFIRLTVVNGPLMKSSVERRGVRVSAFDTRDGWITQEVKHVSFEESSNLLQIELRDQPGAALVRVILKGTGEYPLLNSKRIPLAGELGGAAGSSNNGNDFVAMVKRS